MKQAVFLLATLVVACATPNEEPEKFKGQVRTFGFWTPEGALSNCVEFYPDKGHSLSEYEAYFDALGSMDGVMPFPNPCHVTVTGYAPDSVCLDAEVLPEDFPGMLAATYQYIATTQDQPICEAWGGFYKKVR